MTITGASGQLDQRIIAALQLNGRASWKQVAAAVGATESTVARRGQQLLDAGTVTVTGVLDHLRCGLGISLQVRLRCRPGTANIVAEALAALDVTRFVTVVTGSADVAAEFVVPHHRDVAAVLVDGLPRPDDIVETEAMVVVRKFSAVEEWDTGLLAAGCGRPPAPRRRPIGTSRVARARAAHRAGVRDRRGARGRWSGVVLADRRGRRRERLDGGAPGGVTDPARLPALPDRSSRRR